MNRPKDPALRQQLLERAVHYVLQHGVGGLSLRPMAKHMGTTARMLIHHFGSKEALIADVLVAIEEGFAKRTAAGDAGSSVNSMITRMWTETTAPEMDLALRAVFEVWGHVLVHPTRYASFRASLTEPWIEMLRRRFEQAGHDTPDATTFATLAVGAFQGLQLIRLTSGNDARSTAALETLMQWLEHANPRRSRSA